MPVAVQAVPFLVPLGLVAVVLGLVLGPWYSLVPLAAFAFVLFFFRDPERVPPAGDGLVLAPADGRVAVVESGPGGARVSIFLSLFNCHINRSPVTGVVRETLYSPGRFHPAWQSRASRSNERNHIVIETDRGVYGVTQIAGVAARRIVCSKSPGDQVRGGERIGLIQFGSRTDLLFPPGVEPIVKVGDSVRGGLTVMAIEQGVADRAVAGG